MKKDIQTIVEYGSFLKKEGQKQQDLPTRVLLALERLRVGATATRDLSDTLLE